MPRIASALLVVGLLVATAAAFAVTERLKLVRSPLFETQLDRGVFSPVCRCDSDSVEIAFSLRAADRLTLSVVDGGGRTVRTLLDRVRMPRGPVTARWDGRDDDGRLVAEGTYRPRVHLDRQRRTIELPNPMRVDVTAPAILELEVEPREFSPDGDGRRDRVSVRYRLDERGRVLLYVNGELRVTGRRLRSEGKVDWFGTENGRGLPAGEYELAAVAVDAVGNRSRSLTAVPVTIRYVELEPASIRVRAGARFSVDVRADAASVSWRLGSARGREAPGTLVLRAPRRAGRYALVVEASGRAARASVIVERRRAR